MTDRGLPDPTSRRKPGPDKTNHVINHKPSPPQPPTTPKNHRNHIQPPNPTTKPNNALLSRLLAEVATRSAVDVALAAAPLLNTTTL